MKMAGFFLLASALFAQSQQPSVSNAHFESRSFSGSLDSQIQSAQPTWFGYAIKAVPADRENCCGDGWSQSGCVLEGTSGRRTTVSGPSGPVHLEGSTELAVLFRVSNNAVEKVRAYPLSCPLDGGGLPFVWFNGVPVAESLHYLDKIAIGNGSSQTVNGAIFAISQHDDLQAEKVLEDLTRPTHAGPHVRSQAIFWLAQKAGQRAVSQITDAIENDPDTKVKKQAVFALSQLPKEEGVPKLIEIARSQRNPEVRKQAFFWLGQSGDPRALAFIQEVLTR